MPHRRRNGFRYEVRPGQIWSVADTWGKPRYRIRIDRIDSKNAYGWRVLSTGEEVSPVTIRLRTLSHGLRQARLEHEAPGTAEQVRPKEAPMRVPRERTASEFIRKKNPRGMGQTEATERMVEIDRRRRVDGETYESIAKSLKVTAGHVRELHQRFKDIENLKAIRRAG